MDLKTKLFKWSLKRQLGKIKANDIIILPNVIEIEVDRTMKETIRVPISIDTPSWFSVIKSVFKELLHFE